MTCNVFISCKGLWKCDKSLIGCIRSCRHHPGHEQALADLLAKPPLYVRRLDATDEVRVPYEDHDSDPKQVAKTRRKRAMDMKVQD